MLVQILLREWEFKLFIGPPEQRRTAAYHKSTIHGPYSKLRKVETWKSDAACWLSFFSRFQMGQWRSNCLAAMACCPRTWHTGPHNFTCPTYMHLHKRTYICICICILYVYACAYMYLHVFMYMCTHTYIYIYVYVYIYDYLKMYMHTHMLCIFACVHVYLRTYICIYVQMY